MKCGPEGDTKWLQQKNIQPEIGVVLGTGLHSLLDHIEIIQTITYAEIPHFPLSTVEFHKGNLIYGNIANKKIVCMQGRFHAYEGYSLQQVVFPIRVIKFLSFYREIPSPYNSPFSLPGFYKPVCQITGPRQQPGV